MPNLGQVLLIGDASSLHAPCFFLLCHAMLVGRVVRNYPHLKRAFFSGNPNILEVKIHVGCIIAFANNNFVCVGCHTNLWVRIVMENEGGYTSHENCASKGVVGSWGLCPSQQI